MNKGGSRSPLHDVNESRAAALWTLPTMAGGGGAKSRLGNWMEQAAYNMGKSNV